MNSLEKNETTAPEQSSETPVEEAMVEASAVNIASSETSATTSVEEPSDMKEETKDVAVHALPLFHNEEEVVARARELAAADELADKAEVELLKVLFYKFHNAKMQEAFQTFVDGGGEADKFQPQVDVLEPEFREAMQVLRQRRANAQLAVEQQKQENLERKLAILARIQELASTPEEASQAFDELKALQAEWKEIKLIPADRATELWKNYQLYVENFYDLLKLGHELRDYDFRKNLEIKTSLCEQAEALAEVGDVIQAFNQLQGLHQQWKETGPVAKDLRDDIWNRFKAASTVVNKRHQAHFEALKAREEENLTAKTALCEQLESLSTEGLKTYADWDAVTQKIIDLQTKWKTIGFAPQKMNAQIFERFRKGCDIFFEQKAAFFQQLKESLGENLARKKELVEQAESLKDSTEWRKTGDLLVQAQKQWKEIGPVPRKYSDALWKRFSAACDAFFAAKQAATSGVREEENANLEQKKTIIQQLQELAENGAADVLARVRELQQNWNEVGHVPFREKDRIYKEYRALCDRIYDGLSATRASKQLDNFRSSLAQKVEKEGNNLQKERQRMMKAYERMRDEVKTYENNLGFLSSNSRKGNSLVDTMNKKVEKLRAELELLKQKIKAVDERISAENSTL